MITTYDISITDLVIDRHIHYVHIQYNTYNNTNHTNTNNHDHNNLKSLLTIQDTLVYLHYHIHTVV